MKKYFIFLILLVSTKLTSAQNWQWAKHIGSDCGSYNEKINSVISDGSNIYVIGKFYGCLYLPNDTLFSNGFDDIFISKFDGGGGEIWSKQIGSSNTNITYHENANAVFDPVNNCIYLSGTFINTIDFGNGIILNSYSTSNVDNFIARMDLNGNFIWAKKCTGNGIKREPNIYVDSSGNIYLLTQTADSVYFDGFHVGPGGTIAKYDPNGICYYAQNKFTAPVLGNTNAVFLNFIGSDIFLYGAFRSIPFQIDTALLIPQGNYDAFIARADSNGGIKWIKTFGNAGLDYIQSLSIDNFNNIYIIGGFQDSIDFGNRNLYNTGKDIVIAKFDVNGNLIWNKQLFVTGNLQSGNQILSDLDGNSYIAGLFSGFASFGAFNLFTSNASDMFLARYDQNGNCMGVRNFGEASCQSISIDSNNNVICGGFFKNTVNIGGNTFTSYLSNDLFLAKIDAITGIGGRETNPNNQLIIYANPNAGKCNITVPDDFVNEKNLVLSIYDNTGKLIQQTTLEMNEGKIKVNLEAEAKGVYNVTLSSKKKSYNGKIVFE